MRLSLVAAALTLCAAACAVPAEESRVWSVPAEVPPPPNARAELLGAIELRGSSILFGGISGLEVSADGARIAAISDRSVWLEARLEREGGRLSGVSEARLIPLLSDGERPSLLRGDAEGLAAETLDGPRFVSFEQLWRVGRFDGPEDEETPLPGAPEWEGRSGNEALEALALAPDGRLLAIRERRDEDPFERFEGWWLDPRTGESIRIEVPRIDGYVVTGADFGPDGRLYLLVRTFSNFLGFRFAVQRFRVEADALVDGEVLAKVTGVGADNGEGIAVWRPEEAAGGDGRTRVLVISDDNFNLIQRTLLYEFAVPD